MPNGQSDGENERPYKTGDGVRCSTDHAAAPAATAERHDPTQARAGPRHVCLLRKKYTQGK